MAMLFVFFEVLFAIWLEYTIWNCIGIGKYTIIVLLIDNNKKDKTGYFWFFFGFLWNLFASLFLLFCFVFEYLEPYCYCKTPLQYSANSEGWTP